MLRFTLTAAALAVLAGSAIADDKPLEKKNAVKLKSLTLNIPESWEESKSSSNMRLGTYSIPAAEGKEEKGELAIYNFGPGGGSVDDNLERWVGQFAADGREVRLTKGSANDHEYYIADISGTYNMPIGPPIRQQTKASPGYRMLGVILLLKDGVYFLKMTGEDETIKAQADALRASFGGDVEKEEEYSR